MSAPTEPSSEHSVPARIVVMGVSAVGKSTVGSALAERLGIPFLDADDLHDAAAVASMAAGIPLTDIERMPWLGRVGMALAEQSGGAVIACSALARRYRDAIRTTAPGAVFVHLDAPADVLAIRARAREGHFMPASLLASQLATLEPLDADEEGFAVDASLPVDDLVTAAVVGLTKRLDLPPAARSH
ncbi:MAG: gluconokinase, GntK/IdnK-type [Microbacterium sp.]|uniref:gluconokinase n=1 Tax=Microbacterium sp. TaxID=51671 RepID=UPI002717B0BE|nr:gluconokinase, GntK/IdnK-type [Microbacterium sp.]MDO8381869.1 gluconokinase, GntK/IdnK-type [Microbacterium sp.]